MEVKIDNFIKVNYKVKGNIDIKESTAEKLKLLEKKGVQINLLIAGLLDSFDYEKALSKLSKDDNENKSDKENEIEE